VCVCVSYLSERATVESVLHGSVRINPHATRDGDFLHVGLVKHDSLVRLST